MMCTRSDAPNPSVWNLHAKPAVEGNRCVEIAANEVYLIEDWLAHPRATSCLSTVSISVWPLSEPCSPFSNSIQPSLKPSSICARRRVLGPLRSEQSLPGITRHGFHAYRTAEDFGEGFGDLIRSDASRSLQFDDAAPCPCLSQDRGC